MGSATLEFGGDRVGVQLGQCNLEERSGSASAVSAKPRNLQGRNLLEKSSFYHLLARKL